MDLVLHNRIVIMTIQILPLSPFSSIFFYWPIDKEVQSTVIGNYPVLQMLSLRIQLNIAVWTPSGCIFGKRGFIRWYCVWR